MSKKFYPVSITANFVVKANSMEEAQSGCIKGDFYRLMSEDVVVGYPVKAIEGVKLEKEEVGVLAPAVYATALDEIALALAYGRPCSLCLVYSCSGRQSSKKIALQVCADHLKEWYANQAISKIKATKS